MSGKSTGPILGLNALLAALDRTDSFWPSNAIAAVYHSVASLPDRLLQDFDGFAEADLAEGAHARAAAICAGRVPSISGESTREQLFDAGRLLRALEIVALEDSRHIESDFGPELEQSWQTSDGKHFVIPRLTPLKALDDRPFLRRALLHYRVVPTYIDDFRVRLHRASSVAVSTEKKEIAGRGDVYGAGLFEGLTVSTSGTGTGFIVDGLTGCCPQPALAEQVAAAREDGCIAIVWAELTMPQSSLNALREILGSTALDGAPPFRFLVAGSWHRSVEGEMRNVAPVLECDGTTHFEVFKWAKFKIGGRPEAIIPGDEIHLLILENGVVAFAICRDFLQDTAEVPYKQINADVVIVPSMTETAADQATMGGHASTAQTMRVRYGTRTLVVAQPSQASTGVVGQVMSFPARPQTTPPIDVRGNWLACPLETP